MVYAVHKNYKRKERITIVWVIGKNLKYMVKIVKIFLFNKK